MRDAHVEDKFDSASRDLLAHITADSDRLWLEICNALSQVASWTSAVWPFRIYCCERHCRSITASLMLEHDYLYVRARLPPEAAGRRFADSTCISWKNSFATDPSTPALNVGIQMLGYLKTIR